MPNTTKLTTLPGGLRVATCEMPHAQTAAMGIWASVGGRHEPAALNGISHFIEHMLFKGTGRRSARRIMQEIEGVGGDMNAYTAEERTCYYATAAAEFFPRVCDVLCDIYTDPKFSAQDIERERGVIAEEIQMYRDDPSSQVQELLSAAFWPGHPLGRPITGTVDTVNALERRDFLSYRASHYHAASTVVSAAGRVSHGEVVERVARRLSVLKPGRLPVTKPSPKPATRPRVVVEARDVQQTQVAIALAAPGHRDASRFAYHLMHVILGGNASSRLFQELREKRGLCYSVSTHPLTLNDGGALNISAGLDRKNLGRSLRLILAEFERLREIPVGPAELRRAKEFSVGSSRMSLERASSQNMRLGGSVLGHGKIVDPEFVHEKIRAVTRDEVREVARRVLDPARITLAVVGPSPDETMLARTLGL
jgi:predicted Zn-dependent peptidase